MLKKIGVVRGPLPAESRKYSELSKKIGLWPMHFGDRVISHRNMEQFLKSLIAAGIKLVEDAQASTDVRVAECEEMRANPDKSLKAKAQRSLANSTLGQTTAKNELKATRRRHSGVVAQYGKIAADGLQAVVAIAISELQTAAVEQFHSNERGGPTSSTASSTVPTEASLLWKTLAARGVPASALDQLNADELDVIAGLFCEKVRDYRHVDEDGLWIKLWRAGVVSFPVEGLSADESAALQAMSDKHSCDEVAALAALNRLAGISLQITPALALALWKAAETGSDGLRKSVVNADARQHERTIAMIMETLSLPPSGFWQAHDVYNGIVYPELDEVRRSFAKAREDIERIREILRAGEAIDQHFLDARRRIDAEIEAEERHSESSTADGEQGLATPNDWEQRLPAITDSPATVDLSGQADRPSTASLNGDLFNTRTVTPIEIMTGANHKMDRAALNAFLRSK